MINLFCGWDSRESLGFSVFAHSVIERASKPVALIPIASMGLAHGSNAFTLSRFLIPSLMEYRGHAIFVDASDMLMLGDIAELDSLFNPDYAVQVVKHPSYQTQHRTKYKGTEMECPNLDYPRKNWASVMVVNCEHPAWREIDVAESNTLDLLQFKWIADECIGLLPSEWNCLIDEGQEHGKILHWTAGMPGFGHYQDAPEAKAWHATKQAMEGVAYG